MSKEDLQIVFIVIAVIMIVFSLAVLLWTIYRYRKNRKIVEISEANAEKFDKDFFITAFGGDLNIRLIKKQAGYIEITVFDEKKVISEALNNLKESTNIVRNGNVYDVYYDNADEIYDKLFY